MTTASTLDSRQDSLRSGWLTFLSALPALLVPSVFGAVAVGGAWAQWATIAP